MILVIEGKEDNILRLRKAGYQVMAVDDSDGMLRHIFVNTVYKAIRVSVEYYKGKLVKIEDIEALSLLPTEESAKAFVESLGIPVNGDKRVLPIRRPQPESGRFNDLRAKLQSTFSG